MLIIGWVLLVMAKWPQLKRKEFLEWGVVSASKATKRLYKRSYGTMLTGLFLVLFSEFIS